MKIISIVLINLFLSINLLFAQSVVQKTIDQFAEDMDLKYGSVSISVINIETGEVIGKHNEKTALPTASTAKLFSTATALNLIGPNHRQTTKIYYDGTLDSTGVLNGNIWIRGGGDPTLGSKYFTRKENQSQFLEDWSEALKKHGITQVNGNIIADASEFGYEGAPNGWSWVDMGNYYGAGPSGLTIYDNLMEYHFSTPSHIGQLSTIKQISPSVPDLSIQNYVVSSSKRGDNAYIYGAPFSLNRFVTGTLPAGRSKFIVKGSIPDPENLVAYEFTLHLKKNGISVNGTHKSVRIVDNLTFEEEKSTLIHSHKGEKLIDIINLTNFKSNNLFAEHMLSLIAYEKKKDGRTAVGLEVMADYWSGLINDGGLVINDGSGLSRSNAISANHYTQMLQKMSTVKFASEFKNSLPVAGVSGTLKSVCKDGSAANRMYAKSGTMTRIKSYAGYIDGKSGKKYAFAVIANNYTCSSTAIHKKMEFIFNAIANQ